MNESNQLGTWLAVIIMLAGLMLAANAADAETRAEIDAEPIGTIIHDNGNVTVDGVTYSTMTDYHLSAAFTESDRRCLSAAPVLTEWAATDCSLTSTTISAEYEPNNGQLFQIPVVYHVMLHSDGRGEITDALLRSQIDVLNESFAGVTPTTGNGSVDTKIQFSLATLDPDGNATSGINRVANDAYFNDADQGVAMKTALNWDPTRYLNVYTNAASGALGYATFPQESVGDPQDGVVLLWTSVGLNAPQGGAYNGGDTGTHEVGHWLGLEHTFANGCGAQPYSSGDLIGDTVAEAEPAYECTQQASSCGGGDRPIYNFMNYTPDACMNSFSVEQVNRMRCTLTNYRAALSTATASADFEAIRDELSVQFNDRSEGAGGAAIASREWDFGDGSTSSDANPRHKYADYGTYTVTLRVADNGGAVGARTLEVTLVEGETDDGGGSGGSGGDGGNVVGGCSTSSATGAGSALLLAFFGLALIGLRRRESSRRG